MKKLSNLVTLLTLVFMLTACGAKEFNAAEIAEVSVVNSSIETATNVIAAKEKTQETFDSVRQDMPTKNISPVSADAAPVPVNSEAANISDDSIGGSNESTVVTEFEVESENKLNVECVDCDEIVYVNTQANIRAAATTDSIKIATVELGTELHKTGSLDNGWSRIEYNGEICYISSKLITSDRGLLPSKQPATDIATTTSTQDTTPATTAGVKVSNGLTYVPRGTTPNGIQIYYLEGDNGTWPDYMITALDSSGITNDMSEYEKCVRLNTVVCNYLEYVYEFENGDFIPQLFDSMKYGRARCYGYAASYDALCTMAGIYSNVVCSHTHAWNYVIADGTKYWVDTCWNDTGRANNYLMSTTLWNDVDHTYVSEK